jgi:hypothetical protein
MKLKDRIERLNLLKAELADLNKQAKELKEQVDQAEHEIIDAMQEAELDLIQVGDVRYSPNIQMLPSVTDWDNFLAWVGENEAYHLLYKRISTKAVGELVDAGANVPGVDSFQKISLSSRKVRS